MINTSLLHTAANIRKTVLDIIYASKSSHIGSAFSIVDILAVLYFEIMNIDPQDPKKEDRDIFILSKGHSAAAQYAVLAERGYCTREALDDYTVNGSKLAGHVIKECIPGVEVSSGSLGHGLSMAAGMALANKGNDRKFYCLLGDGECNEGSIWEAALFAAQQKLSHLVAIVDENGEQGMGKTTGIADNTTLPDRWEAFGWNVIEVDGHNLEEMVTQFTNISHQNLTAPTVIIAHTIKGKGVSWMEDTVVWHYKSPNDEQYQLALKELAIKDV